jgi:exodeoxyribonuclease V alpha subunit
MSQMGQTGARWLSDFRSSPDAIAMKVGIEKTATVRVRAGISYALAEALDEEHCGLPTPDSAREKLLEVPEGLVRTALDLELAEGTVIANRVWVFRAD